jgi:hypothetical protein
MPRARVNPLFEDIVAHRFNILSVPGTMSSSYTQFKKVESRKGIYYSRVVIAVSGL